VEYKQAVKLAGCAGRACKRYAAAASEGWLPAKATPQANRNREALSMTRIPQFGRRWREIPLLYGANRLFFALALSLSFLLAMPLAAQQMQQDYRQFEIDTGASIYASQCVECHTDGTGVAGVNLKTGQFRRALTDEDMLAVIRNGVPGTAMPPHALSGTDLVALVAYVRSMAQDQTNLVKLGDPEKGKALFENEGGCFNCHRVGDKGSRKALNLSDAGILHPPSYLERALLDPNGTAAGMPESRFVRAVTNKGTTVTGRRLNEDTYTIQLMDDHENLVSLDKDDLKSLTVLKDSLMPSLKGKFADDQISDLVAYLASLKSTQQAAPTQFGSGPGIGSGFGAGGGRGRGGAPVTAPGAPAAGRGAGTGGPGTQRPGGNP
jgi:putative heme-binding domain-containing protein